MLARHGLSLALLFGVATARISRRDLAESFTRHAVIDDLRVAAQSKQGPWAAEWSPSAEDAEMPSHLNVRGTLMLLSLSTLPALYRRPIILTMGGGGGGAAFLSA